MFYVLDDFDLAYGTRYESAEAAEKSVEEYRGFTDKTKYYAIIEVTEVNKRVIEVEVKSDTTTKVPVDEVIEEVRKEMVESEIYDSLPADPETV